MSLRVLMSFEERARLERLAHERGMSSSALVRELIWREAEARTLSEPNRDEREPS